LDLEERNKFEKQHYKVVGGHSAAKICLWTKKSLRGEGVCYKEKFYGIESHRCLQMTPALQYCTENCVFCWRTTNFTEPGPEVTWDEPEDIVPGLIEAQRLLLSGFGGFEGVDEKKLAESKNPNQAAISLSGEPTLYPKLSGLIEELQKRDFTTFLVSNGTNPDALEKLEPLPTQLYVSLAAPNEETFKKICNPLVACGWERLNETLELFPSLDTRKVLRLTLTKGLNMEKEGEYAKLIGKAEPDFIEAKAFMYLGGSRARLCRDNMPSHGEIKKFAKKLSDETGYNISNEKEDSRVVLLKR